MRVPGVLLALLLLLTGFARASFAEDPAHRKLAEHYAPVVFQESRSAVLDFITRFDYDGDWRGDNNWRNAYLFDPARIRTTPTCRLPAATRSRCAARPPSRRRFAAR